MLARSMQSLDPSMYLYIYVRPYVPLTLHTRPRLYVCVSRSPSCAQRQGDHLFAGAWHRLFSLSLSESERCAFFRARSDTRRNGSSFMTSHSLCCSRSLRGLPLKRPVKWKMRKRNIFARRSRSRVALFFEIFHPSVEKLDGEAENCF